MKSKIQVRHYLDNKSFSSKLDFDIIRSYIAQQYKIQLDGTLPKQDGEKISCSDFINWLNTGFEAGEIIKTGNYLGILLNSGPQEAQIYAKTTFRGSDFDFLTVPIQDIQLADKSASEGFYLSLRGHGKEFSRLTLEITDKYIPKVDDLVMFTGLKSQNTEKKCYGIVRMIENDTVTMYCYSDENGEVHYNLHENIGKLDDYQFFPIGSADYGRKKLEELLNGVGKSWNHAQKRIEPLNLRGKKGQKYYYMTDKLTVRAAFEDGNPGTAACKRYQAGNYSLDMGVMLEICRETAEVMKRHMAEPAG